MAVSMSPPKSAVQLAYSLRCWALSGADLHQQQSEFSKHMNSIRLHSLFKKSQSVDFVAALLDALPKFLDSIDGSQ